MDWAALDCVLAGLSEKRDVWGWSEYRDPLWGLASLAGGFASPEGGFVSLVGGLVSVTGGFVSLVGGPGSSGWGGPRALAKVCASHWL